MFETGDLSNTHKMINYSFQHFLQQNLNWFLSSKEKRLCTGSFIWKPNETFIWKYWDWKFNISCQKPKLNQRELGVQYEPIKINGILHGAFSFFYLSLSNLLWRCDLMFIFILFLRAAIYFRVFFAVSILKMGFVIANYRFPKNSCQWKLICKSMIEIVFN